MPQISTKPYILVLPSWYPSVADKFYGDFNQRLVEAVSIKVFQIVLYIVGKSDISNTYFTLTTQDNIRTYLVYYPERKNYLGRFLSKLHYLFLQFKFLKLIFKENGLPQITHVYVFWMAGIAALAIKKIYGIPYLITEHFSGFYPKSPADINKNLLPFKYLFKIIMKNASHIITVAQKLKDRVQIWAPQTPITVIPNVVDTSVFTFKPIINNSYFTFVHISSMIPLKNITGLLDGFEIAVKANPMLRLQLVGASPEYVFSKIKSSTILKESVFCIGEVSYHTVKDIMQTSNALIMFSKFESLPCVIIEALCCGLPVITSNVGGCAEIINHENGIIVESENVDSLAVAILDISKNYLNYNKENIAYNAQNLFNYDSVSQQVCTVYNTIKPDFIC